MIRIHIPGGRHNLLVRNRLAAQADVALNIARKYKDVLLYLTDRAAQLIGIQLLNIHAVNQNLSFLNIVITPNQIQNGGLSGTCRSDESHLLSRLNRETHILQNPVLILICEPDMTEFNTPLNRGQLLRMLGILNHRLLIQQRKNLLCGRNRGLQRGKLFRDILNRLEERTDIINENIQRTDRYRTVQDLPSSRRNNNHKRKNGQHINRRTEDREYQHLTVIRAVQLAALLHELRVLLPLPRKDLNQLHSGQMLGQIRINRCQLCSRKAVGRLGNRLEQNRQGYDERQQHKSIHCDMRIQPQHNHRDSDNLHQVLKQTHQNIREHIVQRLYVVRHPRYDSSDRGNIEETQRQFMDMFKYFLSDIVDNILPHQLQDPGLQEITYKSPNQHKKIHQRSLLNHVIASSDLEGIDCITDNCGTVQFHSRNHQH